MKKKCVSEVDIVITSGFSKGVVMSMPFDKTSTVADLRSFVKDFFKSFWSKASLELEAVKIFNEHRTEHDILWDKSLVVSVINSFGRVLCIIQARKKSNRGICLSVCTNTCDKFNITVDPSNRIKRFKSKIEDARGIPVEQQRLFFRSEQLNDGKTLSSYSIQNNTQLYLIKTLKGGSKVDSGVRFIDVSNENGLCKIEWSESAPEWRRARKGLGIEGYCNYSQCKAYGRKIICNLGFTSFDLLDFSDYRVQCPMCLLHVKTIKPSFNNCFYQIIGKKSNFSTYSKPWEKVGDYYLTYDESNTGVASWISLMVYVKPLKHDHLNTGNPMPKDCCVCLKKLRYVVSTTNISLLNCGHYLHSACLQDWKNTCIEKKKNFSCPMDRLDINKEEVIRL